MTMFDDEDEDLHDEVGEDQHEDEEFDENSWRDQIGVYRNSRGPDWGATFAHEFDSYWSDKDYDCIEQHVSSLYSILESAIVSLGDRKKVVLELVHDQTVEILLTQYCMALVQESYRERYGVVEASEEAEWFCHNVGRAHSLMSLLKSRMVYEETAGEYRILRLKAFTPAGRITKKQDNKASLLPPVERPAWDTDRFRYHRDRLDDRAKEALMRFIVSPGVTCAYRARDTRWNAPLVVSAVGNKGRPNISVSALSQLVLAGLVDVQGDETQGMDITINESGLWYARVENLPTEKTNQTQISNGHNGGTD